VDRTTDPMSAEITNHREAAAAHFALDHAANLRYAEAGTGYQHRLLKGPLGTSYQALPPFRDRPNRNRDRGIGHESILFYGHVEFHEIAFLYFPLAWNTVYDLVVYADAVRSRKLIN